MTAPLNFQHTAAEFAQAIQKAALELGCTPEQVISGLAMDWQRFRVGRERKQQLAERYEAGLNELAGGGNK